MNNFQRWQSPGIVQRAGGHSQVVEFLDRIQISKINILIAHMIKMCIFEKSI